MDSLSQLHLDGDESSLTFECDTPVDQVVVDADNEPNGYFWEGVLRFVAPSLANQLELDSEGSMFCAYGPADKLAEAQRVLEPYLTDGVRIAAVMQRAEAAGLVLEAAANEDDAQPGFFARLFRRG